VGDAFTIDTNTGEINVTGILDFNTLNTYTLLVDVWDNQDPNFSVADVWYGPYTVNVTVTINVLGKLFFLIFNIVSVTLFV